jgi:nucleoside-diphosphate-sugar epimerase
VNVLLTGAFGNVGLSTLKELLIDIVWGDLRNKDDVESAVKEEDVIIHLAAIIPPLADINTSLAESVNVGGTKNLLNAIKNQPQKPKIIFTSSIAVYGDRLDNPMIKTTDILAPSRGDYYALTKITIFRLTYITSVNKLNMDPLMFHMPLDTSIEICDTKDVGLALANAVECDEVWGETFNLAGGERCRITYREYLNDMMKIFGLGRNYLPEEGFAEKDFHCGFCDTHKSENLLHYQKHTLQEYYKEVKSKIGVKRHFMPMVKWMIRLNLLKKSEFYRRFKFFKKKAGVFTISENKLIRKILSNNFNRIELLERKIEKLEELTSELVEKRSALISTN